jgi:hypothetical protein
MSKKFLKFFIYAPKVGLRGIHPCELLPFNDLNWKRTLPRDYLPVTTHVYEMSAEENELGDWCRGSWQLEYIPGRFDRV